MSGWERSEALADVVAFVDRTNGAAAMAITAGHGLDDGGRVPDAAQSTAGNVDATADVLRHVAGWATGTRSFDEFHETLRVHGCDLLAHAYRGHRAGDHRFVELPIYLKLSFGDPVTATYGPEHELSFSMFLIALFKLGQLTGPDEPYVVSVLFDRYSDVVDHLIHVHALVPSSTKHGGGHGNPGLDDYRFLGFVWGSAQLMGRNSDASPATAAAMTDPHESFGDKSDMMFAKCVDAVHRRRADGHGGGGRPPLWWHSYRLWNVAASGRWDLVNRRLVAAYRRHVLRRFDVVRHLVFGQLLRFGPPNPRRPPGTSFYNNNCSRTLAAATATDDGMGENDEQQTIIHNIRSTTDWH